MITKPKLPGLSDREPDFMWLATDSSSLYPVLIEIETPHKPWFYGYRAEIHSDLTPAHGQLAEWRAWFGRGHNRTAFLEYNNIPPDMARRHLEPPLRARPWPPRQLRVCPPTDARSAPSSPGRTSG